MTQPTVHFDDTFPPPQKSEIQELTEAVRDLAAAIRGREEKALGPEFPNSDPVRRPAHYQMGGRECIEFTRGLDFCWGNVVKYLWRAPLKGSPVQDIDKALRYLESAAPSRRPIEDEENAFDFFYALLLDAPEGSAEESRLDALAAVFNAWIPADKLGARIQEVRDRYIAEEE